MNALPAYLSSGMALLFTAPCSYLCIGPGSRRQHENWGMAFAIFGVSVFFLVLPFAVPALKVGHMNWSGKLCSIAAVYACILSRKKTDPGRRFMTFTQKPGTLRRSAAIVFALVLFSAVVTFLGDPADRPAVNGERLLFEATLPGIDEEAVFRAAFLGYLLAAMPTRAVRDAWRLAGPVLSNALLFGLAHALRVDAALHWHFDIGTFGITGAVAVALALLTLNSGSILLSVFAHNLINCVAMLV